MKKLSFALSLCLAVLLAVQTEFVGAIGWLVVACYDYKELK